MVKEKVKKPKVRVLENNPEYDFVAQVILEGKKIAYGAADANESVKGLRELLQDQGYEADEIDWGNWLG